MKREFLTQFLNKISNFPDWVKKVIYNKLSEDFGEDENFLYVFAAYKPVLTYKGKCENDFKKSGFDNNIYNMLDAADKNYSISEITFNTYMSLEEIAGYFLFCTDEGFFEIPDDSRILNVAGFISGKYRTGEFFVNSGAISENQLDSAVENYKKNAQNKKFGQALLDLGLISEKQLNAIISIKEEAKKRFVLDFNDVPVIKQIGADYKDENEIEELKKENKLLKTKLNQLLSMVKKNDE